MEPVLGYDVSDTAFGRDGMTMSPDQRDGASIARRHPAPEGVGLSIVIPVYNEAAGLAGLHANICKTAAVLAAERGLACEIIYVDDGSRDASLALPAQAVDVQVVSLSRNFGKEAELLAGLDHARLGAVLFMDADGQHPPSLIETLVGNWLDGGYDVVYTAKAHRDVHMAVLATLNRVALVSFVIANSVAAFVAMTFNFFFNNLKTYRDMRLKGAWPIMRGLLSFFAVSAIGTVLNVSVAIILFQDSYSSWLAGLAGVLVGAVWNYTTISAFT
jgi:glycosyltransferase involved in cell wall biosynthesis